MITFGKHTMPAVAAIALSAATVAGTVTATERPARADTFLAAYTCTVPILGARPVTIHGSLTADPARAVVNQPIRFRLHISRLSLQSPVAIDEWTATAEVDVAGAQDTSFRVEGTGGAVLPHRPVTGALFGSWTPRAQGTDHFRGGRVMISARVARLGVLTASCTPNTPRPVMETVTVMPG